MNMTSGLGSLAYIRTKDLAESAAYSISKAALNMLTIHQANNLKGQGVVVVCVDRKCYSYGILLSSSMRAQSLEALLETA